MFLKTDGCRLRKQDSKDSLDGESPRVSGDEFLSRRIHSTETRTLTSLNSAAGRSVTRIRDSDYPRDKDVRASDMMLSAREVTRSALLSCFACAMQRLFCSDAAFGATREARKTGLRTKKNIEWQVSRAAKGKRHLNTAAVFHQVARLWLPR
eukprot:3162559-Rhodomonas_salina.1